jgi:hypothetical protein
MRLTHCVLACNENTKYLGHWPNVRDAWKLLIDVPVTLVYIGEEMHPSLQGDSNVILWKPIAGWPTATQAQCVRLLMPGLIDTSGAVIIGDIDCMPLNKKYFHWLVEKATENQLVLSDPPADDIQEVGMMYVAGTPSVWRDLTGVSTLEEAREYMIRMAGLYEANGNHGELGWTSDQNELYKLVCCWRDTCPERLFIHDYGRGFNFARLDRNFPWEWLRITDHLVSRLYFNYYVDFHMVQHGDPECDDAVEKVIDAAIRMRGRRLRGLGP